MIAAGLAGTAFLWYLLSRIAFCGNEKFRRKHFRRALFDALAVPVYLALNLAASALAGEAGGAGAFASAVMTLSAAATALGAPAAEALCAPVAALAVLAVPERHLARARGWLVGEARGACDPDRLAARLRAESGRKLRAMSDAFGELSDGYRIPVDIPDEQSLIADMRARLCDCLLYTSRCV